MLKATFQGEYKQTGYGPQPIVVTEQPLPKMRNVGYNSFACQYRWAEIENLVNATPLTCYKKSSEVLRGGWCGWVWVNGECPAYVYSTDYDNGKYKGLQYSLEG